VSHGTVAIYNEHLKPTMGEIELCRLFSLSEEFKFLVVRQEEKVRPAARPPCTLLGVEGVDATPSALLASH
jgi:hypothetical protein